MAMKVQVSFKKKEKELYDYLMKQLSAGLYLKQLLKEDKENREKKEQQEQKGNIFNF